MSEDSTVAPEAPKSQSLEDLLGDLDEDRRSVILDQVGKARNEAKGLRARLNDAAPKLSEYDRLVAASKTQEQVAQEALATAQGKAAAAVQRAARSEVRAALAGVVDNSAAIIEDLDMRRFVDDEGDVDQAAVKALVSKYAAFSGPRAPRPDRSQGSGSKGGPADPASQLGSFLQRALNNQNN
jgi:hypothetical protein